MRLDRDDIIAIASAAAAGCGGVLLGRSLGGPGEGLALAALVVLALAITLRGQRRVERAVREQAESYRQIEALASLLPVLHITKPLPPLRRWAISPDFAATLATLVLDRRPTLLVELGSGVSTLVAGYCVKQLGTGSVLSLEHDEAFARKSRENVRAHGLETFVRVVHAPLTDVRVGAETWRWYDPRAIDGVQGIDLVVVDGPPKRTQPMARYPAFPLLRDRLSPQAVLLVDDADRRDDRAAVERWMAENPDLVVEFIPSEKGTAVVRRAG